MRLQFERLPYERARVTFYSRRLTWSIGFFIDHERRWGWRPNEGHNSGVWWFRVGSLFIAHLQPLFSATDVAVVMPPGLEKLANEIASGPVQPYG